MRNAVAAVQGFDAQAAMLTPAPAGAPVQMRRSTGARVVQREESAESEAAPQGFGVPQVEGDLREVADLEQSANGLRASLRTRQREIEDELTAAGTQRVRGDRADFRVRTAQLRRDLSQVEEDLRTLTNIIPEGTTDDDLRGDYTPVRLRTDLQGLEAIARRNGIAPEDMGHPTRVEGTSRTRTRGLSETGLGLTTSDTQETIGPAASGTPGRESSVTNTTSTTTNVDTSGGHRSTSSSLALRDGDGGVGSRSDTSTTSFGSNAAGLGVSSTDVTETSLRRPGEGGESGAGHSTSTTTAAHGGARFGDDSATVGGGQSRTNGQTAYNPDGSSSGTTSTAGSSGSATMNDSGTLTAATATVTGNDQQSVRDASGRETHRETNSSSVTAGYVNGENGEGVTLAGQVGEDHRNRESASSGTLSGSATVTDQQVGATGNAAVSMGAGPVAVNGSLGGGASFSVDVREVPDTRPKQYELVTTFRYEISFGVGVGTNDNQLGASTTNTGRAGVSSRQQRTSSYTNRLTAEQAAEYQADLRRGEGSTPRGGAGPAPALRFAARLRAFAAAGHFPTEADLLGNSRDMEMDSEIRIGGSDTTTGTGGGQVGGLGMSAGADASATRTTEVDRRCARLMINGQDTIRYTLVFADTQASSRALNGAVEGIGARGQQDESQRRGVTVVIDIAADAPDRDARERQALSVMTRQAADQLARETGAEITRESQTSTTDSFGMGLMDDGQVATGLVSTGRRATGRRVTTGQRDAEGHQTLRGGTTGSSSDGAALNVLGTEVANVGSATNASAEVDDEGRQHVEVRNSETAGLALPQMLQNLWRTTEQRINSFDISESDMTVLVRRANDRRWNTCLPDAQQLHIQGPWRSLKSSLLRPRPEPDWVRADRATAYKIARGEAITNFIGGVPARHGHAAIRAVLRNFDRTQALATEWEWPDSLHAQERTYAGFRTDIRGARARFGRMTGDERETMIQEAVTRIANGLEGIKRAVAGCGDFQQESAKVEMLNGLDRDIREIHRHGQQASVAGGGGGQAEAASSSAAQEGVGRDTGDHASKSAHMMEAKMGAFRYKRMERTNWRSCQQHMQAARDRVFVSTHDDVQRAMNQLLAIERAWVGQWSASFREYSRLAHELGLGGQIDYGLRTNVEYRIQLMTQAVALDGSLAGFWNPGSLSARWRGQGGA